MASKVNSISWRVLQGFKNSKGFDKVLNSVTLVSCGKDKCVFEATVKEEHLNLGGGMHGGYTATLVDSLSSIAIMAVDKPPGVSTDLSVTYLRPAKLGDILKIETVCVKAGKNLAHATVDITNKETGKLLVQGRQTKFYKSDIDVD